MNTNKILIVDDEEDVLELIKYNLEKEGYLSKCCDSGGKVLGEIEAFQPNLILLDLMLPGIHGLDLCKQISTHKKYRELPIIIISAKGEESDIVTGLEFGADDYVCKPFSPRVLIARIRVILRKLESRPIQKTEGISYSKLHLNLREHAAFLKDEKLDLSLTEFRILEVLLHDPGRVFTRRQLIEQVHGEKYPVTERSIDCLGYGWCLFLPFDYECQ